MNRSGLILKSIIRKKKIDISDVIVICDNLDLLPGVLRLKNSGSSAGHNGIKSIIENAGTENFRRFYIGIGRPSDKSRIIDYVLGTPENNQMQIFLNSISLAADFLIKIIGSSPEKVMNEINRIKNNSDN